MSRTKSLTQLLASAEKPEFDNVVKLYLKSIYNYERIVLTDGKDDGGIDIKVFDINGQKVQYQLTTQRSSTTQEKRQFEDKLWNDVKKAKKNHEEFSFDPTLYFFYSYELTNKVQREYTRQAKSDYGVNLTIVDANQIAEEAEDHIELQKEIYKISGLDDFKLKDSIFDDKEKNLLYDLVSFGKSVDIKLQIVEAFVLQYIYNTRSVSKDELVCHCKTHFKSQDNKQFYDRILKRLSEGQIVIANDLITLSDNKRKEIEAKFESIRLDENIFISGIKSILERFNQQHRLEEYIIHLKQIYSENFNEDLLDGLIDKDLRYISRDFTNFIERNLDSEKYSAKALGVELFLFCDENKFLQKLCASKVFSEKTNLNRLEHYIVTQKKLFIDTTIALYLLCFYFRPKASYSNYYYQTAVSLFNMIRSNKMQLYITDNYIKEVQNHLRDALNLCLFTELPSFGRLGNSRNIFFNFYLFLKKELIINESFESFLYSCGFRGNYFHIQNNNKVEEHLSELGLVLHDIEYEYELDDAKKILQEYDGRGKTNFGLNNDAITLEYLSDNDVDVHKLKPIFITWDRTFFAIYKKFFTRRPQAQRWLLFTPGQIIDHYALVNFSINSETVSKELLAILSDEIIQNTHTLLDSLTMILNPNDEIGLEYTNRLAAIRDEQIYYPKDKPNSRLKDDDIKGELVIDDIFFKLTRHYSQQSSLEQFKSVFTTEDYMDEVIDIISGAIVSSQKMNKFDDTIFDKFDQIITKVSNK